MKTMNKQEVIEKIRNLEPDEQNLHEYQPEEWEAFEDGFLSARIGAELIIEELDKPIVPQFVADWYEENKDDFEWNVYNKLCVKFHEYELEGKIKEWFNKMDNKPIQTLVNMHQFGYEVEKDTLYTASLKLVSAKKFSYLNKYKGTNNLFIDDLNNVRCEYQTSFTQSELEELGVWDNPLFEIKEVVND